MSNLAREPDFAEDQLACGHARGFDDFQRDRRIEHQIVCAPDVAHAAAADSFDHAIAAREDLARGEHGMWAFTVSIWGDGLRRFVKVQ